MHLTWGSDMNPTYNLLGYDDQIYAVIQQCGEQTHSDIYIDSRIVQGVNNNTTTVLLIAAIKEEVLLHLY